MPELDADDLDLIKAIRDAMVAEIATQRQRNKLNSHVVALAALDALVQWVVVNPGSDSRFINILREILNEDAEAKVH